MCKLRSGTASTAVLLLLSRALLLLGSYPRNFSSALISKSSSSRQKEISNKLYSLCHNYMYYVRENVAGELGSMGEIWVVAHLSLYYF